MLTHQQAARLQSKFNVDAFSITMAECFELDAYVKQYTLNKFNKLLRKKMGSEAILADFIEFMVRCHYGSVEVDALLVKYECYPRLC